MLPILMMLLFVALAMCKKDEQKPQQDITQPPPPPQPSSLPDNRLSNACTDDGFFSCSTCPTAESTVELPAGTGNMCCTIPCEGGLPNEPREGNVTQTCAFQKGFNCKENENCPDKQWVAANDTARCCKGECKARVQTEITIEGLGKVVIERFGAGKFGVYYGQSISLGNINIGKASYAEAVSKGNNVYEFEITDKRKFTFVITKETETEIKADPIGNGPLRFSELETRTYLVDKYNPGTSFGLPRVIVQSERDALLHVNPDLVTYVKGKYNLVSDTDIYPKVMQFLAIHLTPTREGYDYAFSDSRTCTITSYEGKLMGPPVTDTVTKREQRTVPC